METATVEKTSLWHNRNFVSLWTSETISQFGSQFTQLALPLTAVIILGATAEELGILGFAGLDLMASIRTARGSLCRPAPQEADNGHIEYSPRLSTSAHTHSRGPWTHHEARHSIPIRNNFLRWIPPSLL